MFWRSFLLHALSLSHTLSQELERQKHMVSVLQHKQEELKEGIRQRDELIEVRVSHTHTHTQTHTHTHTHTEEPGDVQEYYTQTHTHTERGRWTCEINKGTKARQRVRKMVPALLGCNSKL